MGSARASRDRPRLCDGRIARKGGRSTASSRWRRRLKARRGLHIDVTRAREDVTIAYGKDDVQDFGALLVRAQRDNGKVLVCDVIRGVNLRIEREEERKRLRNVAFEQRQKP